MSKVLPGMRRILVAGASPATSALAASLRPGKDEEVVVETSPKSALEAMALGLVDALLLDGTHPDVLQIVHEARQAEPDVPVIIFNGTEEVRQAVKVMKQGATDYLTQSVRAEEVRTALESVLARSSYGGTARWRDLEARL